MGYECIPAIGARARPGGPIARDLFEEILAEFVAKATAGGFAGICLDLHGATIAQDCIDTEGELLERLRGAVGPDIPISVGLDMHGYLTRRMAENATIMTAYRTQPHADMVETGERAMMLLDRLLNGEARPHGVVTFVPFLTRGNDETSVEPMRTIQARAEEWRRRPGLIDLSIFNIHPFVDASDARQAVVAYDDGSGIAEAASKALAQELWDVRKQFIEMLPSVAETLARAADAPRPFVLGDQGDRVLGAGPGDSAEIARIALEQFPDLKVATAIFDPQAVAASQAAGVGATVALAVGAGVNPHLHPRHADWRVAWLGRARFVNKGPYMGGIEDDFGDCAVLTTKALSVAVTTLAPSVHDPAFYAAVGIPVESQHAVVARSGNHYKLSFADCAEAVTVDTAGLTAFRLHELAFEHIDPVYPLADIDWTPEQGFVAFTR